MNRSHFFIMHLECKQRKCKKTHKHFTDANLHYFFRTFEYIQREMPKIPRHIPVIILANHCDMSHHRTVTTEHILYYIESLEG